MIIFGYGARVEYDQTDGTVKYGTVIVPADPDEIGTVYKIERDEEPEGEMAKMAPQFVREIS